MVASLKAAETMARILRKYLDRKTALRLMRDLHAHVPGNKSVMETFARVTERIMEEEDEHHG